MNSRPAPPDLECLLAHAALGDPDAREELLRLYRPYLRIVAGRRMPQIVQKRVDASDIVQQTLIDANRGLGDFRGQNEAQFSAWMMRLLERNLLQSVRTNTHGKRDIRLERDCVDSDGSAQMQWHSLAGGGSSPASGVFRGEAALHLAMALENLPEDQRLAVEMRYIDGQPLATIATTLGRTVGSVAGLIRRGVENLQAELPSEFGDIT
jgi:RNA polymerase sigma-70 factor (ECF subfamily)